MGEVIVLSSDACMYCDVLKRRLELSGISYREVDINSEEGKFYRSKLDIKGLPAIIVKNDDGVVEKLFIGLMPKEDIIKELR